MVLPSRCGSQVVFSLAESSQQGRRSCFEQLEPRAMLAGDAILHWNSIALDVVAVDHTSPDGVAPPAAEQYGPTMASRALAIVHVAMYDAINSIKGQYEPYLIKVVGVKGANIDAAVGQAAHDTLEALYKTQESAIDKALEDWLDLIPDGKAENMGVALGKTVAKAILNDRKDDGWNGESDYEIVDLPGHHQPDPINPTQGLLDPQWGDVKPFGIESSEKFMPPPPPDMNSAEYTKAYNELLRLGGDGVTTPTQRTQEQTEIGTFWAYDATQGLCAPPRLYNQIAVTIAEDQGNTEYENARMLALVNIAMADAGIVGWDSKYLYDFWRPVIGIRAGDSDGNPDTQAIADWTPLGAPASNETFPNDFTPPFPSYVSGHAIFGGAVFKTLEYYYGADNISFSFTSDEFNGTTTDNNGVARPEITREFDSLRYAAYENSVSRIYLGIHWRFDAKEGVRAGNRVAVNIFKNIMEPMKKAMPAGSMNDLMLTYTRTMIDAKLMEMKDGVHRQVVMMQTIDSAKKTTFKFTSMQSIFTPVSYSFTHAASARTDSTASASSTLPLSTLDALLARYGF